MRRWCTGSSCWASTSFASRSGSLRCLRTTKMKAETRITTVEKKRKAAAKTAATASSRESGSSPGSAGAAPRARSPAAAAGPRGPPSKKCCPTRRRPSTRASTTTGSLSQSPWHPPPNLRLTRPAKTPTVKGRLSETRPSATGICRTPRFSIGCSSPCSITLPTVREFACFLWGRGRDLEREKKG